VIAFMLPLNCILKPTKQNDCNGRKKAYSYSDPAGLESFLGAQ
jgi:hypothetical protein